MWSIVGKNFSRILTPASPWHVTQIFLVEDMKASVNQIFISYFQCHIINGEDNRLKTENNKTNNTEQGKAHRSARYTANYFLMFSARFVFFKDPSLFCELCVHDVDLDWVQILLLGTVEDLWHPLGEKNKTVICSQKFCQGSPELEGSETNKTDRNVP